VAEIEVLVEVNQPPRFTAPPKGVPIEETAGDPVTFNIEAVDDDGDTVRVTSGPMPGGLPQANFSGNPAFETFYWQTVPSDFREGGYEIKYTAEDNKGGEDERTVKIMLAPAELVIIVPEKIEPPLNENTGGGFVVKAYGPKNVGTIDLQIDKILPNMPAGMAFTLQSSGNPVVKRFLGRPEPNTAGPYRVTFKAEAPGHPEYEPAYKEFKFEILPEIMPSLPYELSGEFSDGISGGTTSGRITDAGDQTISLLDFLGSRGIFIASDPSGGGSPAVIELCDDSSAIEIPAGTEVLVDCSNSLTVQVFTGTVKINFFPHNGAIASTYLNELNSLTFEPETCEIFTPLTNPETVIVYEDGREIQIVPGAIVTLYRIVDVDIKPGSYPNCFNSNDHGAIPVAILSSNVFDATQVDPSKINMDGQGVRIVGRGTTQAHIEDVNGDGFNDLMLQIEDVDGTYVAGDTVAEITGETFDGYPIMGTDSICIVP
jgi:hypothetical protein